MTLLGFKTILHKKNVGPAKIQRVQQKIPGILDLCPAK
jgi:hypothetical protein